jgi:endonuclease/exonuclease/phosphatase family metal-dependent hydrolase
MQDIEAGLPDYSYVGVGRDDGKTKGEYSAIFFKKDELRLIEESTFWLSETPEKVSVGWDAALPRICTYALFEHQESKRQYWHFNTHFDHLGVQAREESARLIVSKVKSLVGEKESVILSGDFNAEPHQEPILVLKNNFQDPIETVDLKGPLGTFNGFDLNANLNRRIDYIFYKSVKPTEYQHLDTKRSNKRWISDHLPIYFKFKLD